MSWVLCESFVKNIIEVLTIRQWRDIISLKEMIIMSKKSKARLESLRRQRQANRAAKKRSALIKRIDERKKSKKIAEFDADRVTKGAREKIRNAAEDQSKKAQIAKYKQWLAEAETRATGSDIPGGWESNKQKTYSNREELTRKYIREQYWSLTDAAVQGRYEEALKKRKELLNDVLNAKEDERKALEDEYRQNPSAETANKLHNIDIEIEELENVIYLNERPEAAINSGDPLDGFFD